MTHQQSSGGNLLGENAHKRMKDAVGVLLEDLGDRVDGPSTAKTPERVVRMYEELLVGYNQDPRLIIHSALFNVEYDEMVIVTDIDFHSLCEHHLMPFYGKAHVGYLPSTKVVGLSKIPRVVDALARRLQVQERLTEEIASAIREGVDAQGVGVVLQAHHLCASIRGVQKPNASMITSAMHGAFRERAKTREEFMTHISVGRQG